MATTIPQQESPAQFNRRIGVSRERTPITPEQFDGYRPKAAAAVPDEDAVPDTRELASLLGALAGPYAAPKLKLARYISALEKRIAALEDQVNGTPR